MVPKPDLTPYLGTHVEVVVDRPLGSLHPRHPDIVYPVNYGELPGTVSGDGRPIDAYLLGPDVPVQRAAGTVIGVIVREDDVEDKLVVYTEGKSVSAEEIWERVWFQERYFQARLIILDKDGVLRSCLGGS